MESKLPLLTYSMNVHPLRQYRDILDHLDEYVAPIKEQVFPHSSMGVGLWISENLLRHFQTPAEIEAFHRELEGRDLFVFTLNGFPQQDFHSQVVREKVYFPHWGELERVLYTQKLAKLLAQLLPDSVPYGSISTLPLFWKGLELPPPPKLLLCHLVEMAQYLWELEESTGKRIVLAIEPEPMTALELTSEVVQFFGHLDEYLETTSSLGSTWHRRKERFHRYIGVCLDTCHQAVEWEKARESVEMLQKAGIEVFKVQLSNAPELHPRQKGLAPLKIFRDRRYLHQVVGRDSQGNLHRRMDLSEVWQAPEFWQEMEALRVHFHIPLFFEKGPHFSSTRPYVEELIPLLESQPHLHWEVETYTWEVLPEELKAPLTSSLSRELLWARERLYKSRFLVK